MQIRKSTAPDLPVFLQSYEHARLFMAEHGNPHQWGTSDPAPAVIENDIRTQHSYVCEENGHIAATFYFNIAPDPTYAVIHGGSWLDDEPYGVVHRITSDGSVKGAATFCLDWAFSQCGNLRIDTHRDNCVMQKLLAKNNFQLCGIITLENGSERLAYQKNSAAPAPELQT